MGRSPGATRLGIIGCGRAARVHHLPALARLPGLRVVAAADTDSERLTKVTREFGIERRYADYRELMEAREVDAVAVLTPTKSHAEISMAAIETGRPVFVDKPLAMTLEECDRIARAAEQSNSLVLVGLNHRWHRLLRRARDIIRSGALGPLKAIRSLYTHRHPGETAPPWHRRRDTGGGVIFNDGVHHFDLWRFLLETEVLEVFAHSFPSAHFEDDTSTITATLANGMLASAVLSFSSVPESELEIFGEHGRLIVSCYRFDGLELVPSTEYSGSASGRRRRFAAALTGLPRAFGSAKLGGETGASYDGLWRHFSDCIHEGVAPEATVADGRTAVGIVIATLDSVSTGRPVKPSG